MLNPKSVLQATFKAWIYDKGRGKRRGIKMLQVKSIYRNDGLWIVQQNNNKGYKRMNNEIKGVQALRLASEVSKLQDGYFDIAFYPYNSTKGVAVAKLKVIKGCKVRKQLPTDRFARSSENFFLFTDADGKPKMCYKYLIRYISFPQDEGKLRKVIWIN